MDPSLYRNNNQIFTETEAKTGKLLLKERKLRETQASSKCLGTQTSAENNIFSFGKLYSSRRTSAFLNPLVRDNRVLGRVDEWKFFALTTLGATGSPLHHEKNPSGTQGKSLQISKV